MKIVHLSSVHPVGDTRILHRECRTLAREGYDVVFVCAGAEPARVGGVRIEGVPMMTGRLSRATVTAWRVLRRAEREKADLYHLHDPELIWTGLWLTLTGRKVVFDLHEDLPSQVLSKSWIPEILRRPAAAVMRVALKVSVRPLQATIVAEPDQAALVRSRRLVVVQNFPRLEEFDPAPDPDLTRETVVAYVGGVLDIRGACEMVQAVQALPDELSPRLVIAGPVQTPGLMEELDALDVRNRTDVVGRLDREGVRDLLARSSVALCVLRPEPNYVNAYPTKMFEYMAACVPVVCSDFPLWRSIIEEAGCGILVDPLDVDAITAAIVTLLEDPERARAMGFSGRASVERRYNWDPEGYRLLELYSSLLEPAGAHVPEFSADPA